MILKKKVCRELFYAAEDRLEVVEAIVQFNQSTIVIPPSEWNPKILIEPPETYLSKVSCFFIFYLNEIKFSI